VCGYRATLRRLDRMDTIKRTTTDQSTPKQEIKEEELNWSQTRPLPVDLDNLLERVYTFKDTLYKKFKKRKKSSPTKTTTEMRECAPGDELTRELEDAWYLYTKGEEQIASRDIGHVLRILGQNPTEDEVVDMVMKANCEWEGLMGFTEFLDVGIDILKSSCNQMDDVKAAFKVFDHNNDGSISKDELRDAMVNFGTRCTDDEFDMMFHEADQNQDGKIDFDEFVAMMLPATMLSPEQQQHSSANRPT